MGILKPTDAAKRLLSVFTRRPVERHVSSDPKVEAQVRAAGGNDFEADLNPPKILPRESHSHPQMMGPGLSTPGITNRRRAGFRRKVKRGAG
jgi:hypothetical protein